MIILTESQGKAAKRRAISGVFGNPADADGVKARIRLLGTFLRNGSNAYDQVYACSAGCYEFLSVAAVWCDGDEQEIVFSCVDDHAGDAPGMTWREIAAAVAESGADTGRCEKFVIKFAPETDLDAPVDAMAPGYEVYAQEGIDRRDGVLTVGFAREWWVTDSRFFEDWSQSLWEAGGWDAVMDDNQVDEALVQEIWETAGRVGRLEDVRRLLHGAAPLYGFDSELDDADDCYEVLAGVVADLRGRLPWSVLRAMADMRRGQNPRRNRRVAEAVLAVVPRFDSEDEAYDWVDGIQSELQG